MNKNELKSLILYEKEKYIMNAGGKKQFILKMVKAHPDYFAWKYLKCLRKTQYYYDYRNNNIFTGLMYLIQCRRKNNLGRRLGIEVGENCAGKGLMIFHTQGVVINGNARLGENCMLHGNNCIGNNGIDKAAPIVGNNVDIGVGAKIIGDIYVADNIKIGAGAVVISSCYEKGATLVGMPAHIVKKHKGAFE